MFYKDYPCEWCDRKNPLTLLVETPDFSTGKKVEQYSYLCVPCINDTHGEALQQIGRSNIIRIK